jgi:hypothetical protein
MHEISRMTSLLKTGCARLAGLAVFLQTHSQASLRMGFQKLRSICSANDPVFCLFILFCVVGVISGSYYG